jgi:dihydroorotase-like cyclic amidohydrolase
MVIRGAALALPGAADFVRRELRVEDGRFAAIAEAIPARPGEPVLEAAGRLLFPGAIDPHVHFDEPGFEQREDFLHGSSAAARGGVTTVIDMPCTSLPPVTTRASLDRKLASISRHAVVDFALFGGVSGATAEASLAEDMTKLAPEVVGFKCYFISGMESFTAVNHWQFERIIARGAELGRPILLHAEDRDYVMAATAAIQARAAATAGGTPADDDADADADWEGAAGSWDDYVASRPEAAELAACAAALALARGHEGSLHVVHVGTPAAASLLAAGGASCETCAHYLAFSSADFTRLGSALKTAPPVKSPGAAEELWRLLAQGIISFCASDHAPAPAAEKHTGSLWTDYGGIPGSGTMLPWLLSEGLFAGRLDLARFLEITSAAAARRYGLDRIKGSVETGKHADFCLVDPAASTVVEGSRLLSKGSITPFEGLRLRGRITGTWLRGQAVWDAADEDRGGSGIVAPAGCGRHLHWGQA